MTEYVEMPLEPSDLNLHNTRIVKCHKYFRTNVDSPDGPRTVIKMRFSPVIVAGGTVSVRDDIELHYTFGIPQPDRSSRSKWGHHLASIRRCGYTPEDLQGKYLLIDEQEIYFGPRIGERTVPIVVRVFSTLAELEQYLAAEATEQEHSPDRIDREKMLADAVTVFSLAPGNREIFSQTLSLMGYPESVHEEMWQMAVAAQTK